MAGREQGQAAQSEIGVVEIGASLASAKSAVGLLATRREIRLDIEETFAHAFEAVANGIVEHVRIKKAFMMPEVAN